MLIGINVIAKLKGGKQNKQKTIRPTSHIILLLTLKQWCISEGVKLSSTHTVMLVT